MRVPEIRVQRLLGLGLGLGLTTRYELSRGWITNITLRTGAELPNFGRGGGRIASGGRASIKKVLPGG